MTKSGSRNQQQKGKEKVRDTTEKETVKFEVEIRVRNQRKLQNNNYVRTYDGFSSD